MSSRETIFCRNLKNAIMLFLGLKGLSYSKVAGFEGVVFLNYRATIFVFISTQMVDIFELFSHETNWMKKRSVSTLREAPSLT